LEWLIVAPLSAGWPTRFTLLAWIRRTIWPGLDLGHPLAYPSSRLEQRGFLLAPGEVTNIAYNRRKLFLLGRLGVVVLIEQNSFTMAGASFFDHPRSCPPSDGGR